MARLEQPMRLPAAGLNRWVKSAEAKAFRAGGLNIGPRLVLGFVFIILSMLAADAVVLWQFHLVQTQAERLNGIDQKLIAVLRLHTSLTTFHDRLEDLADSQDIGGLVTEGERLRTAVLDESRDAMSAFSLAPFDFHRDPTILPILHSVQSALPAQLEAITTLAKAGDWRAVHQRLANQIAALQSVTLALVERVDHEVGEEQAQTVRKIKRVQRLVFLVVPLTAVFTLLIAGIFGLSITRSITQPLARLVEGSKALARGDFQHKVPVIGRDELAELGRVFNDTARRLQDLYATLRRSEAYLAEAQRLSRTGSWARDAATDEMKYSSEEFYRVLGFDPHDGPPRFETFLQRVHPDDQAKVREIAEKARREKEEYELDYRVIHPGGDIRDIHVIGHPVLSPSGDLVEFIGTVMDITDRKRAEEALRRSEGYLAEAERLSHTGSWASIPAKDENTYWSEECYRVLGFDPHAGQLREKEFFERIHPDEEAKVKEAIETAARENTEFELDYRIVHPGGEIRNIHTIGHPVFSPSGDLVEYVGTVIDITERKRAEESLRRSEGYLAEVQRLSHTGSWAWNAASRHSVYWSQENYRLFGFDPEGGIPSDEVFYQCVHPEDRDRVRREVFLESPHDGSHFDVDFRIVLPGGAIKYVRSTGHPVRNISGDLVEYIGTSIDITELKRAEDRTRLIIDTVPAQIWTEGPDGVVDFVNRRWIDYTGMTLEQAVGSGWNRMVHPDDIERVLSTWRILISEGKPREIESRLRRSDGTYRWFLSRCCPLVDGSGQILGWYGSDTDIHDRKEVEEKLRQSEAHLQEAQTLGRIGQLGLRYCWGNCIRLARVVSNFWTRSR